MARFHAVTDNPIAAAVAPGYEFAGPALELGGLMLDETDLSDVHIKIPLAMLNRHGLVAGATGTGKTKTLQLLAEQLQLERRTGLRRRHQGRPLGDEHAGHRGRQDQGTRGLGRADLGGQGLPGDLLRPRRSGHRDPAAGDDDVVRADPAQQGARAQRHPGVQPGPGLPLRRPGRAAAARPQGPAGRRALPHQRRGQTRPQGARRAVGRDRRGDPARADRVREPGCRRVLR